MELPRTLRAAADRLVRGEPVDSPLHVAAADETVASLRSTYHWMSSCSAEQRHLRGPRPSRHAAAAGRLGRGLAGALVAMPARAT